jgi:hypothetical protein
MRALLVLAVVPGLLAANLAGPAAADWHETQVTQTPEESRRPRVTFDRDDDLHVLWEEAGEILHRLHTDTGWEEVEIVGTGSGFDHWMCLS